MKKFLIFFNQVELAVFLLFIATTKIMLLSVMYTYHKKVE